MDIDLKMAIFKSGKCQWEIAQAAGISETRLSKHLRGYGQLREAELRRLHTVLAMDVGQESVAVEDGQ